MKRTRTRCFSSFFRFHLLSEPSLLILFSTSEFNLGTNSISNGYFFICFYSSLSLNRIQKHRKSEQLWRRALGISSNDTYLLRGHRSYYFPVLFYALLSSLRIPLAKQALFKFFFWREVVPQFIEPGNFS